MHLYPYYEKFLYWGLYMKNFRQFSFFSVSILSLLILGCVSPTKTSSPRGDRDEVKREEENQKDFAFQRLKTEQKRLNDIGYKILSANSELCNETTHVAGFSVWNDVSIDKEYRDVVKRRYNLTDALEISEVYEGMPAQRAGLRVGDKILSINGTMVEKGLTIDKYQSRFRKKFTHQNLNIDVLRNNERLSFNLNPQRICNYPVALIDEDIINAFADGSGIYIYRGMSRFTSDDDELALVI